MGAHVRKNRESWNATSDDYQDLHGSQLEATFAVDDAGQVTFQRAYGDWVGLFRTNGLVIEDLIEPQPPTHAQTSYTGYASVEWAHRWPAECLWVLSRGEGADPV